MFTAAVITVSDKGAVGLREDTSGPELCRILSGALRHLTALGAEIGSTDLEGQLSCCEYYKNIFSAELENQQEKNKKYSKLFPPLGLLAGVSAAILMI